MFHSPPTQVVNLGYLWVCPYITTLLYFEMLTSYFNTLVEEAIPVALQVCSSSASQAVHKPSSQLSGKWLPLLEAAPGAGGLTWDLEIFDPLLCSWNSEAVSWLLGGREGRQIPFPVWLTEEAESPGTASSSQPADHVSSPARTAAQQWAVGAAQAAVPLAAGSDGDTMDHDQSCASQGVVMQVSTERKVIFLCWAESAAQGDKWRNWAELQAAD